MVLARPWRYKVKKKLLGLLGLAALIGGALMFWRRKKDDDAFLDEELE